MLDLALLVDYSVSCAEIENGIPVAMVRRQSNIPPACMPILADPGKPRRWTDEEIDYLRFNLGFEEESQIAEALGRSRLAVHLRWSKYMDLPAPSKNPDYLTAQQIARRLDLDAHKVCSWIDRGMLEGEIVPGGRRIRRVRKVVLLRWLTNTKNWIWFDIERVRDPKIRRLLELKRERWGNEWWNTRQVADYHHVKVNDVKRYIKIGKIKGIQAHTLGGRGGDHWAHWFVLRSEAIRKELVFQRGSGSGHELAAWSEECDAFLLLARAVGMPVRNIAVLMHWDFKRVDYRLRFLRRAGKIPGIIERQRLDIQYRKEDGALLADWESNRERFPCLARVMDEFHDYLCGRKSPYPHTFRPGQYDPRLLMVRSVLQIWTTWYANNESSRDLAYRLHFASHARPEKLAAAWVELQGLLLEHEE